MRQRTSYFYCKCCWYFQFCNFSFSECDHLCFSVHILLCFFLLLITLCTCQLMHRSLFNSTVKQPLLPRANLSLSLLFSVLFSLSFSLCLFLTPPSLVVHFRSQLHCLQGSYVLSSRNISSAKSNDLIKENCQTALKEAFMTHRRMHV